MATLSGIWALLSFLIKYGPDIWNFIQGEADDINMVFKKKDFMKAAQKAEDTGDQRDLENEFDPGRHDKPKT